MHCPVRATHLVQLAAAATLAWAPAAVVALAAVAISARPADAQATGRITGLVTSEGGQPLASVQVAIPNTQIGAVSGPDGRYTINGVAAGSYQLRAQRIGYAPRTQTVTVSTGQTTSADFQLTAVPTALTTQVVVGYTTQQRRDVSDATASVTAEQLRDQKVATVEEALRGQVAGVNIAATGEPGRPAQVIIRGQTFLGNSSSPLYVVDGMYMGQNPNLNPDDIASIEVLKDASAAAQYGAQAANGVIVIRTKRGQDGAPRVELSSYYGFQSVPNRIEMASVGEWSRIVGQAFTNANTPVPSGVANPVANTDWQDQVFTNGAIQNYNLTASGGAGTASYLISGGYLNQQGSIMNTGFERYSFRVNSEARRGRFVFGEALALSSTNRQFLDGFPLIDVVRFPAAIGVRDSANVGGYAFGSEGVPTFGTNPVGALLTRDNGARSNQVIGSAYGEVRLIGGLRYRLNVGLNYEDYNQQDFAQKAQLRFRSGIDSTRLTVTDANVSSLLFENLLTYEGTFRGGADRFSAVGGVTEQRQERENLSAYREGFGSTVLQVIDAGPQVGARNGGNLFENRLRAFLGRASYTLADRYTLTGSARRDCSSRFGASNRCGNFGAGSVAWTVSSEPFFASLPLLNQASFLKFRGSYGVLGNQDIGDYRFQAPINQNLNYLFGSGTVAGGATQLVLVDPNIRWQEDRQRDVGFDLGLFDDRLTITADAYNRESRGVLVAAPLQPSSGASGTPPVVNAGSVQSRGYEFGAQHRYESGRFRLNTNLTLATNKNKVLSLGNGGQPIFAGFAGVAFTNVGGQIGELFVKKTAGIFQSAAEVQAHTTMVNGVARVLQPNAKPGDVRFVDVNGDGRISNDGGEDNLGDRYAAGNPNPDLTGGLFFDARYRALDFALNMRGSRGAEVYNVVRFWTDRLDDVSNIRAGLQPWTPENPSTTTPRAVIGTQGAANADAVSDRWIEDADFLRIQNIVLGYTLPTSFSRGFGLRDESRPRVYVNVQNAHTFTNFSNWDPETLGGGLLSRGFDDGAIYPNVRTVSVGFDLRF